MDSFKATLEEVFEADLIVHVRDISHPQSDFQRETVLRVIREIGVSEEMLSKKYIEVWNKIDLVSEEERKQFTQKVLQAYREEKQQNNTILLSCATGYNKDRFLEEVGKRTALIKGKGERRLTYESWRHNEIIKWLKHNAQIAPN